MPGGQRGPVRLGLAGAALVALVLLGSLLFGLDVRLAGQHQANRETLEASRAIVVVNRQVRARVDQLSATTEVGARAVAQTEALAPLLEQLRAALATTNQAIGGGRSVADASTAAAADVEALVAALEARTSAMVGTTGRLAGAEAATVALVRDVVADLERMLADAGRIRRRMAGETP